MSPVSFDKLVLRSGNGPVAAESSGPAITQVAFPPTLAFGGNEKISPCEVPRGIKQRYTSLPSCLVHQEGRVEFDGGDVGERQVSRGKRGRLCLAPPCRRISLLPAPQMAGTTGQHRPQATAHCDRASGVDKPREAEGRSLRTSCVRCLEIAQTWARIFPTGGDARCGTAAPKLITVSDVWYHRVL